MELCVWTYEGPPHVGAMRIANSFKDVHYVLHAPQGDTYADLLFTMIERRDHRPPVTYTTFQARDLGGDTAGLVKDTISSAYERFRPAALLVGESCTAELIQDQPGALAKGLGLPVPVVPLELPSYSKKENWGAAETFYALVRNVLAAAPAREQRSEMTGRRPRCNLLGPTSLGFRCRDDVVEITRLLGQLGVDINVTAPLDAHCADLERLSDADFNICLYPEIARTLCRWLEKTFGQPTVATVPLGVGATRDFLREIGTLTGIDPEPLIAAECGRLPWYSRSIDSTYLTAKRVYIFADGTHAMAAARIAKEELGFDVVGIGTFSRELAREVRTLAAEYGLEALITDDYLDVEEALQTLQPELVLGTQMERHVAKRLGVACAVISSPVHVQDFPARYSPQMGFEGANVIFDTWVHPLMMGLEEHLLHMFRDDFEFNNDAGASHHHGLAAAHAPSGQVSLEAVAVSADAATQANAVADVPASADTAQDAPTTRDQAHDGADPWTPDALAELKKIPFFVRGKAKRNTEAYADQAGLSAITIDTLYDAKAHYAR